MSILITYRIRCNQPECTEFLASGPGLYPDRGPMAELVNDAEALGWLTIPPNGDGPFWSRCLHYCPMHADAARMRASRRTKRKGVR